MKKTTYQIPEIRDEKDNIIQPGTYGKNSPLCNETNDGVLDYVNNNLEYLKSTQDSVQSDYFSKAGGKITGDTEIESKTIGQYNIPLKIQVPDLNDGEGVYLNLGKEGTIYNHFSFGFEYKSNGDTANAFSISAYSGPHYTFDAVGNANFPGSLTSPTVNAGAIAVNGAGLTTTSLTASGETSVPTANSGNKSKTIANTEFVQNSIASLVDSAPDTLNTLNELAKALGNDANFAATVASKIGEKISKSGDTITGPILYGKTPNDSAELVNKSYTDTTAKTQADIAVTKAKAQTDIAVTNAHHYIQRNTTYNVGDVLTNPNLPYGTIIVVTQAGTTGADEPDWNTIKNNIGGMVVSDGTAQFKTVTLYEDTEYHDYSTLTVTNGTIIEPTSTYWIKRGKWIYVNISGILTNDGTSPVYISGLPAPAYRVNASMFSNRSTRCIGLFSIENGKFATLTTGEIEQLYASFAYMI